MFPVFQKGTIIFYVSWFIRKRNYYLVLRIWQEPQRPKLLSAVTAARVWYFWMTNLSSFDKKVLEDRKKTLVAFSLWYICFSTDLAENRVNTTLNILWQIMHAILNFLFLPNKIKLINKPKEDKNTKKGHCWCLFCKNS